MAVLRYRQIPLKYIFFQPYYIALLHKWTWLEKNHKQLLMFLRSLFVRQKNSMVLLLYICFSVVITLSQKLIAAWSHSNQVPSPLLDKCALSNLLVKSKNYSSFAFCSQFPFQTFSSAFLNAWVPTWSYTSYKHILELVTMSGTLLKRDIALI